MDFPLTLAGEIFDSSYEDDLMLSNSNQQVGDDLPPITMVGQILGSSCDDVMCPNQQVGDKGLESEISCPICGCVVFRGIEVLYIHYQASHCLQDEVKTCQMPKVISIPHNPIPILPLPNPSSHIPYTPCNQDNQELQFVQVKNEY
ncbi:hypothetical protein ACLB2K_035837 [Fragaria x ananassa]